MSENRTPGDDGAVDRDLARFLDAPQPGARSNFKDALRARFLAGDGEAEGDDRVLGLLDSVAAEPARPEFKAALREQFLAAAGEQAPAQDEPELDELEPLEAPRPRPAAPTRAPRQPVARRSRQGRAPSAARKQRSHLRLVVGTVLASAAAVMLWWVNRTQLSTGPQWSAVAGSFVPAAVTIDDVSLASLSAEQIAPALASARTVSTGATNLRLQFDDYFVVELGRDSVLDLTAMAARTVADGFELAGDGGSFYFSTGPRFKAESAQLAFRAPDMRVEVVGTIFAVDVFDKGTCLCCSEGEVRVIPLEPDATPSQVASGLMSFIFREGGQQVGGPIESDHQAPLDRLEDFWAE